MKLVVRLGDGGSVVIVSVVIAAAPLIRLNGDAGLKAQVDSSNERSIAGEYDAAGDIAQRCHRQ